MKKYKPLPLNTVMVKAVLEGRKTQTRRIIKPQPDKQEYCNLHGLPVPIEKMPQLEVNGQIRCERCNGVMFRYKELYGIFYECVNCGHTVDIKVNYGSYVESDAKINGSINLDRQYCDKGYI